MHDAVVEGLWRYPVKSMQGEQVGELTLGPAGADGDRRYAVRFEDGKLGSGKSSRRFRYLAGLLDLRAELDGDRLTVIDPGGEALDGDRALSAALGQDLMLVHDPGDPYVDAAPIHVLTTASLDWMRERLPQTTIEPRRFRPNILVRSAVVEDEWVGRTLRVGEAELEVVAGTVRCAMTSLSQPGIEHDADVLRTIEAAKAGDLGVYAEVVRGGMVRLGDPVTVGP